MARHTSQRLYQAIRIEGGLILAAEVACPAYVEVDMEAVFFDDLYAYFTVFWLLWLLAISPRCKRVP